MLGGHWPGRGADKDGSRLEANCKFDLELTKTQHRDHMPSALSPTPASDGACITLLDGSESLAFTYFPGVHIRPWAREFGNSRSQERQVLPFGSGGDQARGLLARSVLRDPFLSGREVRKWADTRQELPHREDDQGYRGQDVSREDIT